MNCKECSHAPHPDGVCPTCPCSAYVAIESASFAPSGGDQTPPPEDGADDKDKKAGELASKVDQSVDSAIDAMSAVDATGQDTNVQQYIGHVHAADSAVDQIMVLLGVEDPDEGDTKPEDGAQPLPLAHAASAALKAAVTAIGSFPADVPAEVAGTTDAVRAADADCTELVTALSAASSGASSDKFADGEPGEPGGNTEPAAGGTGQTFTMPIMVLEGVDTGDGRYIRPEALSWRELPIPVMAITETGFGHEGAQLVGHITAIERFDASAENNPKTGEAYGTVDVDGTQVPVQALKATGEFASIEAATQVADLIRGQFLRGVSVDLSDVVSEIELLDDEGEPTGDDELDLLDELFFGGDMREVVTEGRVMGATVCPFPAFEGAYITVDGSDTVEEASTPALQASVKPSQSYALHILDQFGARDCEPCNSGQTLTASAGPMAPPLAWFEDPGLDDVTPLTITDDGRIFGHLAAWGTCHTGLSGRCVTPPKSKTDYAYFLTGAVKTADGQLVSCGQVTLGTGHADIALSPRAALAHYDDTGSAVADIAVGEDGYGIWFSGAMRPDVTELQVRQLRASPLSGDWRQYGRGLELIAALAVNVQGYPVTRARTASGGTSALVAAGAAAVLRRGNPHAEQLETLKRWQQELEPFFKGVLDREARRLRDREMSARAARIRRRVHSDR
jgi:hypothetical protein